MHGWLLCVYLFLQVHLEWILKKWMTADCDLWEVDCCWDGCVGMLSDPQLQCMVLLKTASCHFNQPLCQGWMVFFSLGGHLHESLKLFLTPSHVRSEAKLCCRNYFWRWRKCGLCNMPMWRKCHIFFLEDPHLSEILIWFHGITSVVGHGEDAKLTKKLDGQ